MKGLGGAFLGSSFLSIRTFFISREIFRTKRAGSDAIRGETAPVSLGKNAACFFPGNSSS
jgi:hypothetical protein